MSFWICSSFRVYGNAGLISAGFPYTRDEFIDTSLPFDVTQPAFPTSAILNYIQLERAPIQPRSIRTCNFRSPCSGMPRFQREPGGKQTLTATCLGSDGRRLLRADHVIPPALVTPGDYVTVTAIRNAGYSHYNAFQLQFQRRMSACNRSCPTISRNRVTSVRPTSAVCARSI